MYNNFVAMDSISFSQSVNTFVLLQVPVLINLLS